ncbi:MAG: PadR family transcriptional regulator [Sarcina sp.]
MTDKIIRKVFNGFIYIHILYHGKKEPFYGSWIMEELREQGYNVSPGTLYPILRSMLDENLLEQEEVNVNGKIRKYYKTTEIGNDVLKEVKEKIELLTKEV